MSVALPRERRAASAPHIRAFCMSGRACRHDSGERAGSRPADCVCSLLAHVSPAYGRVRRA